MDTDSNDWRKKNRKTTARKDWREVFYLIRRQFNTKPFTLSDVENAVEKIDPSFAIPRESLRVKMARYCEKNILRKAGRGKYILDTKTGFDFFKIIEQELSELRGETRGEYD